MKSCPCCSSNRLNTFNHSRVLDDCMKTIQRVQCLNCWAEAPLDTWNGRRPEDVYRKISKLWKDVAWTLGTVTIILAICLMASAMGNLY